MSPHTRLRERFWCAVICSIETFCQLHSSSSATSCARPVCVPWPISARTMRMTVVSSGFTTTHAFTSESPAVEAAASAEDMPKGTFRPSASPPPAAAAEPTMNLRRERFGVLAERSFMGPPSDELLVLERQVAHRLAGRREYGVHDGRGDDADRRLAHATPEIPGRCDHRLYFRKLGE